MVAAVASGGRVRAGVRVGLRGHGLELRDRHDRQEPDEEEEEDREDSEGAEEGEDLDDRRAEVAPARGQEVAGRARSR